MESVNKPHPIDIPKDITTKWQNVIDIMAKIVNVPAGLIMRVVESDITVFLSSKSADNPYPQGAKEHLGNSGLYCETVIKTKKQLIVPNALNDENWKNNPDVKLNMISYLGLPISFPDKTPFGTICVLDNKENPYSELYVDLIKNFRNIVENDLELLFMNYSLGEKNKQLNDYLSEIQMLRGIIPICTVCKKIRDDEGYWNKLEEYVEKHSEVHFSHGMCDKCSEELYGDEEWYRKMKLEEKK